MSTNDIANKNKMTTQEGKCKNSKQKAKKGKRKHINEVMNSTPIERGIPGITTKHHTTLTTSREYSLHKHNQFTQMTSNGEKCGRSFAKAGATAHLSRVPGSLQEP